ncbi:conserved hypothetical protein [methanotrophic bacterial endosymbiont of Bathymodiolus sp.]|nr:conserved hypothetical protein [methanotrophic bacterial endosymbiont of Bathymodiolus sp.]
MGVFLRDFTDRGRSTRLPHARGGVSVGRYDAKCISRSSPRPWGCFPLAIILLCSYSVFPTPVGVFLVSSYQD